MTAEPDADLEIRVYELHAQIMRTLSDPRRLMILDELHGGERSVSELVEAVGLPQAKVSQHLALMRMHNIVVARREGNNVYYSLASPKIVEACNVFHEFLMEQVRRDELFAQQFPAARPHLRRPVAAKESR